VENAKYQDLIRRLSEVDVNFIVPCIALPHNFTDACCYTNWSEVVEYL
jgi:hypothetical protein